MNKLFIPILTIVFFIGCGSIRTEHYIEYNRNNKDIIATKNIDTTKKLADNNMSEIESEVINTIMALPEIAKQDEYIEEQTGGKSRLAVMITETPEENNKGYYTVNVSEDND